MRPAPAYLEALQALLPLGPAWPRDPEAMLSRLLGGIADGMARVDGRALALLDESDPYTALELLPDWERVVGLPDSCNPVSGTIRDRQLSIVRKLAGEGGQSRAFFIRLAALLGLEIEIDEFRPFAAGAGAGEELCDDAWRFAWVVVVLPPSASGNDADLLRFTVFSVGESSAGDRLRSFGAAHLECVIARAAPGHTVVLFSYPADPEPALWFDFTT